MNDTYFLETRSDTRQLFNNYYNGHKNNFTDEETFKNGLSF